MDKISSFYFYLQAFGLTIVFALLQEKFYKWKQRDSKVLSFFIVMIPTLVTGLRYYVGTDYKTYVSHTRWYSNMTFYSYLERDKFEVGHYLLIQLNRIFDTPYLMFFVVALLTMNFFYEGLLYYRKKISLPLAIMLYLLTFFPHSMNGIRQYLAVSIIFYGYRYIFQKNLGKYLVCVIVAMSFHLTAVIAIPFYFIHQKYSSLTIRLPVKLQNGSIFPEAFQTKILQLRSFDNYFLLKLKSISQPYFKPHFKPQRIPQYPLEQSLGIPTHIKFHYMNCFLYLFLIFLYFNFSEILTLISEIDMFSKYTSYITREREGENRELYLTGLILFGVFLFRRELKDHDPRNELLIPLLTVGFLLGFLGFIDADIKRISLYFDVIRIVLLASLPKLFVSKELKTLFTSGLIIYALYFFLLMFYILEHSEIFPYQNILGEGQPLDMVDFKDFLTYLKEKKEGS